jgi:hypothetical protein
MFWNSILVESIYQEFCTESSGRLERTAKIEEKKEETEQKPQRINL